VHLHTSKYMYLHFKCFYFCQISFPLIQNNLNLHNPPWPLYKLNLLKTQYSKGIDIDIRSYVHVISIKGIWFFFSQRHINCPLALRAIPTYNDFQISKYQNCSYYARCTVPSTIVIHLQVAPLLSSVQRYSSSLLLLYIGKWMTSLH